MASVLKCCRAVAVAALAAALLAGTAHAASYSLVQGRGSTSQFLCPSGTTLPANIAFQAGKNKGVLSGSFNILGAGVQKFGNLSGGTSNQSRYSLSGILNSEQCGAFVSQQPFNVTISGDCGVGVVIHYTDTAGERGDFLGNVACT
jgi:hypothetical protein